NEYAALRQSYNSLLASDPFPFEEPLLSALPECYEAPYLLSEGGAEDVVFGDSYISGEGAGAGTWDVDSVTAPAALHDPVCHVSRLPWPRLIHTGVFSADGSGRAAYQNYACSGAIVSEIAAQVTQAAQDAGANGGAGVGLGPATKLVQVSAL